MAELGEEQARESRVGEFLDVLNKMGIEGVLQKGHEALLRLLVAKVAAGEASHQEMAVLRNILRDNGMMLGKVIDGRDVKPLPLPDAGDIPELDPPSYTD